MTAMTSFLNTDEFRNIRRNVKDSGFNTTGLNDSPIPHGIKSRLMPQINLAEEATDPLAGSTTAGIGLNAPNTGISATTPDVVPNNVPEEVTPIVVDTNVGQASDFGLNTLEQQKAVLSGQDALTASLFSQQQEIGASRAASQRGRAGQEAELRGLSETQEAAAVGATERNIEDRRLQETAQLTQLTMARSDQAARDLLTTELQQAGQKKDAYNAYSLGVDWDDPEQVKKLGEMYTDAYGGEAPSYSQLVEDQQNANEALYGKSVTNYMQTQGYNIGNIPVIGTDPVLDKMLMDLYEAESGIVLDRNNLPLDFATWRDNFTTTTVSSETAQALENARAEKAGSLQNKYPEWNVEGSGDKANYDTELGAYDAEQADAASAGWSSITLPDGTDGYIDSTGLPVGLTGGDQGFLLESGYAITDVDGGLFVHIGNQDMKVTQADDGKITYQVKDGQGRWGDPREASDSAALEDALDDLALNGLIDEPSEGVAKEFDLVTGTSESMFETLNNKDSSTDSKISAVKYGLENIGSMTTGEKRDFYRNSIVIQEFKNTGTPTTDITSHGSGNGSRNRRKFHNSSYFTKGNIFIKGGVLYTVVSAPVNYHSGKGDGQSFEYKRADGTGSTVWEKNI